MADTLNFNIDWLTIFYYVDDGRRFNQVIWYVCAIFRLNNKKKRTTLTNNDYAIQLDALGFAYVIFRCKIHRLRVFVVSWFLLICPYFPSNFDVRYVHNLDRLPMSKYALAHSMIKKKHFGRGRSKPNSIQLICSIYQSGAICIFILVWSVCVLHWKRN